MATLAQQRTLTEPRRRTRSIAWWRVFIYGVCIVLAILFLFPIVWSAISSVKPPSEASAAPPTFLPSQIDFANYAKLNTYGRGVWTYVGNSAITAIITVIGSIILSTLAGYGFARFNFPLKEEAALLDGCSALSMLYRVMFAIVRPGIITVGIYAFLNSWNEFLAALIFMTREANFTLPILLTSVRSGYYGVIDWGALQAGLMVSILPCVLIFLLLQRYYVSGLTGGATKG